MVILSTTVQTNQSTNGTNLGQFTCLGTPSILPCTTGSCPSGKQCLSQEGTTSYTCQFPPSTIGINVVSVCPDPALTVCGTTLKDASGISCPGTCTGDLECTQNGLVWGCTEPDKPLWREGWFIALVIALIVIIIIFIIFLIYYFSDSNDKKNPGETKPPVQAKTF